METKPIPTKPKSTSALTVKTIEDQYQIDVMKQLDSFAKDSSIELTEYGRTCAYNVIGGLITHCRTNGIDLRQIDASILDQQIRNIAYTELNIATSPAECYFDLRKIKVPDENGNEKIVYSIKIAPQGAGNEKLVRKFGVNVKEIHPAWLIREGDEYTLPSWEGGKLTPPSWKMKSLSGKVIMVIYRITKQDGSEEYLIADRDAVKQSLISQIRQNSLYAFKKWVTDPRTGRKGQVVDEEARNQFYKELEDDFESRTVEECLKLEKYEKFINPTYTSGGSRESMMIRKMKNIALKNYPKEYDSSLRAQAVVELQEDYDETIREKKVVPAVVKDVIDVVEGEVEEVDPNAVPDFDVPEDDGVVEEEPKEEIPHPTPAEEPKPEGDSDDPNEMF